MATFEYEFEELPLVTVGDVEACLINGEATVEYDRSGVWEVIHITVDGYRNHKPVQATAPLPIHAMVLERLYGSWRYKVEDAVAEQLDLDRELEQESKADMIRGHRVDSE